MSVKINRQRKFPPTGAILKKTWKSLRDTFARYIKRISTDGDITQWIWADQMQFFLPYMSIVLPENSTDADGDFQNSDSKLSGVVEETEYLISDNDYSTEEDKHHVETVTFAEETPGSPGMHEMSIKCESPTINEVEPEPEPEPRAYKRKRYSVEDISTSQHQTSRSKKSKIFFDELDTLLLAHAKTIRKFSRKRQAITKYKIAQVILEQELLDVHECPNGHDKQYQDDFSDDSN